MEEIWKDIKGYEGLYQISNLGRVRSLDMMANSKNGSKRFVKGKIKNPFLNQGGYLQVHLSKNGKRKMYRVHRLVYEAFIGEIPKGYQVNHKDENKQNNILSNIDTLMTPKENLNWGTRNERAGKSLTNHPQKSKPVIQKSLDGKVIKIWPSANEIQRQLGYSQGSISKCCNGNRKSAYKYIWQYEEDV